MTFQRSNDESAADGDALAAGRGGKGRRGLALALGLLVLPVQLGLLALWSAATDLTLVEALARPLGMTTSGLPGYFLVMGLAAVLFALVSLGVTYAAATALLRSRELALLSLGSAVGVLVLTGMVVAGNRSAETESVMRDAEKLSGRADERVETLASRTRLEDTRVEPGPLYESMGATADNPRPEWGELLWSVRIAGDLIVPAAGSYGLTVEYRLPGENEPHARVETELVLEEGRNPLDVTLDANDSRDYQGFWDPARAGGSFTVALVRELTPGELYGDGLDAVTRSAERLFGRAAEDLRPTSRTVELLRERIEL